MGYSEWIHDQYARGLPIERIAEAALRGPVMLPGGAHHLAPLLQMVAAKLQVAPADVHIVGSSRYGFSLHDGAIFDPAFSDLDLAVVDPHLHARCALPPGASPRAARFPERDLPAEERAAMRQVFDDLSRSVAHLFAYVSVAVFPDLLALVQTQAGRINSFLGIHTENIALRVQMGVPLPSDENLQAVADAGLPQFMLSYAESTPSNASPWLANTTSFAKVFGCSAVRQARLKALERAFRDLSPIVDVQCCLVGGSFVDISNPAPNDLDIVVFYCVSPESRFEIGRALQRLTRKFQLSRIDMRFVPCDAESWLLVKVTSFFTTLYQNPREGSKNRSRGLVLLIPDSQSKGAEMAVGESRHVGKQPQD